MHSIHAVAIISSGHESVWAPTTNVADWPVFIGLLGPFRLLKNGQQVAVRSGSKTESLLSALAIQSGRSVPREALLEKIWHDSEMTLASQSLHTLVYSLHKQLGDALHGAQPVLCENAGYRLNSEAGVASDVACFDALRLAGSTRAQQGDHATAMAIYSDALQLYRGDLSAGTDVSTAVERERLRAGYLTLLARLACHYYDDGDFDASLNYVMQLLTQDPCREDAHRLAMRCYVRRGERSQAMHQFRLCEAILRAEYGVAPEPATCALFEKVCQDPSSL